VDWGSFLAFFAARFSFKDRVDFFLGLSSAAPFFRHDDSPDKGWVVLMSIYRCNTLLQANIYVFSFMWLPVNPAGITGGSSEATSINYVGKVR